MSKRVPKDGFCALHQSSGFTAAKIDELNADKISRKVLWAWVQKHGYEDEYGDKVVNLDDLKEYLGL